MLERFGLKVGGNLLVISCCILFASVPFYYLYVINLTNMYVCENCSEDVAPAVEAAAPLGETMDLMTALQMVLRKSLANGSLARGLHEGAKVIEKNVALLCVLAEDCDQPDYVKLVKALCNDHNVSLMTVPSAKTLGEWAGVSVLCFHFDYLYILNRCCCLFVCWKVVIVLLRMCLWSI